MRKFVLVIFSILSYSIIFSQGFKPPLTENIQSPNASNLGKYGDIPVSLYTGTPEISVPIYQLNEGNIPLNIAVNYDATGVRVNSVPGWVGQNWSLQAGGVIIRTVRGNTADELNVAKHYTAENKPDNVLLEDESNVNPTICSLVKWPFCRNSLGQGYRYNLEDLNIPDWSSTYKLLLKAHENSFNQVNRNTIESWQNFNPDTEPDFFTFNFMGHTGKFFLGQDGQWKVSSSSNLKIICDFPEDLIVPASIPAPNPWNWGNYFESVFPRVINKITILDDKGNKYYFGTNEATELTFPNFFKQRTTAIISSAFYLQSVYDAFGNQIYKFEYEKGPYAGHFYLNWGARGFSGKPESNGPHYADNQNQCDSFGAIKAPGQLILPIYLKKITTRSGTTVDLYSSISNAMKFTLDENPLFAQGSFYNNGLDAWEYEFNYFSSRLTDFTTKVPYVTNTFTEQRAEMLSNLKWKKLDNIVITDKLSILFRADFNYINEPSRRLFLQNITVNYDKKYSFEYYNDNLLPTFLSSAIDHLGYYNGNRFSFTCSTTNYSFWRNYHLQRNTDPEKVKYGSLKKIIYPGKGFTEFEFEQHSYSKEIDNNGNLVNSPSIGIMGGLRIKKTINNDGYGNNYISEYQYTNSINSSVSSGNLLFRPNYFIENISIPIYRDIDEFVKTEKFNEFNISPIIPLTNIMGNQIEYESVIEKKSFFNSKETIVNSNGHTIYKYSNFSQFPDLKPINTIVPDYNPYLPVTHKGFERGKLLEKSVYDANNILKKRNTYTYNSNQNLKVNAISFRRFVLDYQTTSFYDNLTAAYQIFYTDKYITEEKEELFSPAGLTSKIKKYSYKRYPEMSGTILNFGDLFKSTEYEQHGFWDGSNNGVLKTYKYPFDYSDQINTGMLNNRLIPSVYEKNEFVTGDPYDANDISPLDEKQTIYKEIASGYGDIVQVPESILYKKGTNNFETRFKYLNYDFNGNLQDYKTENDIPNCLIWGYNQTQPIAKIENASYSSIPSSLIIAIQNASNTGTEASLLTLLASLRNDPALANSMVTTYTYIPMVGVSSITDAKGETTTFTYDDSGRLELVKDKNGNILSENQYHYKP